jgi:uncharacterized protein (TIGR03086 family)
VSAAAATAWLGHGTGLLERAIGYALGAVAGVTPELLDRPTPCGSWDLRTLLHHLDDSAAVLQEAVSRRRVGPVPAAGGAASADPAADFRGRAAGLLGAWAGAEGDGRVVAVGGLPLAAGVVAAAGAVEIAVHGWDVARACGRHLPVPHRLATDLLRVCPLLVPAGGRDPLFAPSVAVPAAASPSDRLVALLGRDPRC